MVLYGDYVLTGLESIQGKKDPNKWYPTACLNQGIEPLKLSVTDELFKKLQGIPMYSSLKCVFDYNDTYKNMRLISADVAKS